MESIQKVIYQNKIDKGFNTTNIELEFCCLHGELAEAYDAYRKKEETLGEELADVAIFLYGLAEILGYDLDEEVNKKVSINKKRKYVYVNGVTQKVIED